MSIDSKSKITDLLTALQGVRTALETKLDALEAHAKAMADSHAIEVAHRQAMETAAQQNLKTLQSMFDWFSKSKDGE